MHPSNRVRTANPVSVRVRVMVSASLSSAAVESLVLIESHLSFTKFIHIQYFQCSVSAALVKKCY